MSETCNNEEDNFPERVYSDPLMNPDAKLLLYKGTWLINAFYNRQSMESCLNFPLDKSDIMVATFPRSGTTWTQEIVYRIMASYNSSKRENNNENAPDMQMKFPMLEDLRPGFEEIKKRPSPRLIKAHLPYHLLPKKVHEGYGKIIYVARNPKDCIVSGFHCYREFISAEYKGDLKDYFESFMEGTVAWGSWFDHVKTFWDHRDETNILFITYEELTENKLETISRISEFLGVALDKKQLVEISEATTFDAMKKDSSVNYSWWKESGMMSNNFEFMRKGQVGDWKNFFTTEMNEKINQKFLEPLKECGLTFNNSDC